MNAVRGACERGWSIYASDTPLGLAKGSTSTCIRFEGDEDRDVHMHYMEPPAALGSWVVACPYILGR